MKSRDVWYYFFLSLVLGLDFLLLVAIGFAYKLRFPVSANVLWEQIFSSQHQVPNSDIVNTPNTQDIVHTKGLTNYNNMAIQKAIPNFNQDYDVPPVDQRNGTSRIPVLIYHHIGPVPGLIGERIDNVTPEILDQQLKYLQEKQYVTLTIDEYIAILKSNQNPVQKSVLITFDDGYEDQYKNALPLLKNYGFTATFFIPVNRSEITPEQLKEMSEAGMDIEAHTMSHYSMTRANTNKIWDYELNTSKSSLEAITGKPVKAFAYPYCYYSAASLKYVTNYTGYELAFRCGSTTSNSIDETYNDRLTLYRSWQYNNLQNFIDRLSGIEYRPADPLPDNKDGFHIKLL